MDVKDCHIYSQCAINIKVVILGYIAVGKTSFLNRFVNNTFSSNIQSTTGVSYSCKLIYVNEFNQNIKFDIWDTSGQEKYKSLNKLFYKDAKMAVLMYDITNKESFIEMMDYWYSQLKQEAPENLGMFN